MIIIMIIIIMIMIMITGIIIVIIIIYLFIYNKQSTFYKQKSTRVETFIAHTYKNLPQRQ